MSKNSSTRRLLRGAFRCFLVVVIILCNTSLLMSVVLPRSPTDVDFAYYDDYRSSTTTKQKKKKPTLCPAAVASAVGLYASSTSSQHTATNNNSSSTPAAAAAGAFHNVVLLVAANYGYYDFLKNWERLAHRLHLKWAVVAMDDQLYNALLLEEDKDTTESSRLRYHRSVLRSAVNVPPEASQFRQPVFNAISCNKLRSVLQVMDDCPGVNVVFTDVDNVFFADPFDELFGRLIRAQLYDYIYQPNFGTYMDDPVPRNHSCFDGVIPEEANTGFYYLDGTSEALRHIIRETLYDCSFNPPEQRSSNGIVDDKRDDQSLFWKALHRNRNDAPPNSWHHCTRADLDGPVDAAAAATRSRSTVRSNSSTTTPSVIAAAKAAVVSMCCLDPYYHPVGQGLQPRPNHAHILTFHANYAMDKGNKIDKLSRARPDGLGWTTTTGKEGRNKPSTISRLSFNAVVKDVVVVGGSNNNKSSSLP